MGAFSSTGSANQGSFGSSSPGLGGGFGGFGGAADLNTPQGLLTLAQQQGGSVAEAANELVHPQTSILSTIGDGFKNAFHDFVDTISIPSEAVAGIISPNLSIGDAISQHVTPSDVIFGAKDPNATTMQKVGSFLVRTAVDVLTDPLTYVTFGAGEGVFGLRSTTQLALGDNALSHIVEQGFGPAVKDSKDLYSLSKQGQNVYSVMAGIARQATGHTAYQFLKTGDTTLDLAGSELEKVLKATVNSPLDEDFAKKAMANLLEAHPALTETLLDKGGIKAFGLSVLSGQRISSTMKMLPGMTQLDNVMTPVKNILSAPFSTNMEKVGGKWEKLPGEFTDIVQKANDLAIEMADSRISQLPQIIKKFDLTPTESQFLVASVEAGKMPVDARLAEAFKAVQKISPEQYQMMVKAGIPVTFRDAHFPHMLVDGKMANSPFKVSASAKTGATQARTIDQSIFTKDTAKIGELEKAVLSGSNDVAQKALDAAKNAGMEIFDPNFFTAHAARTIENVRATTAQYMMRSVVEKFGSKVSEAPRDWRAINLKGVKDEVIKQWQPVAENAEQIVFNPAIAQRVEKVVSSIINDDATNDVLKAFDSLQNYWKASVTAIFPAFHGRNAISNALQSFMDLGYQVANPWLHATAADTKLKDFQANQLAKKMLGSGPEADAAKQEFHDLMHTPYFTDRGGSVWTYGEFRQALKNNQIALTSHSSVDSSDLSKGVLNHQQLFPESSIVKKVGQAAKTTLNPLSSHNIAFETGRTFGGAVEDHARMVHFLANLKNTGDVSLAAKRTKQFLFDYGNLTGFEKTVMKRLLPFYTYTRKNIEMQVRGLMETPGRTAALASGLNTLGEVIAGSSQLSQQEQDALPDWVKSGINILTKKQGENVTLLSSLGTPLEQPFQALQANQLLGSLSPLIRVPIEQMSGYSFYQGKPLSEVTNAAAFHNAPEFVKQIIGYTQIQGKRSDGTAFNWDVSLNPEMMNLLLNLPPTARVLSAMKQMNAVDVADQEKLMQQTLGIRPYSFDLVQEQQKRNNEMRDKLQTLLTNAGITAQFTRTYIPKGQ